MTMQSWANTQPSSQTNKKSWWEYLTPQRESEGQTFGDWMKSWGEKETWFPKEKTQSELASLYANGTPDIYYDQASGKYYSLAKLGVPAVAAMASPVGVAGELGASMGQAVKPMVGEAAWSAAKSMPSWMMKHKLLTAGLGLGGYTAYANLKGGEEPPSTAGVGTETSGEPWYTKFLPGNAFKAAISSAANAPVVPAEEPSSDANAPPGQPIIVEVGGRKFWWDPVAYSWNLLDESSDMAAQLQAQKELQAQAAAEEMAKMYATDPYKYWAQLGQMTPEAVARLTGGKVEPGQPFSATPLSTPSAQWWGNLLPSEQTQVGGALNWMGINPEDWYSIYQRMIPGMSQRQVQWAR